MKLLIMQLPPILRYLFPLPSKISLHSILEYPQPMFFFQSERPSFTPVQNKGQKGTRKNLRI
jgi:hypothetical protein